MKLLFDIGGTNMRLAVSKSGNKLDSVLSVPTPKNFRDALAKFSRTARQLTQGQKIDITIGGAPRFARDQVTFWHTHPVIREFSKVTKSKVILENDAALDALGEAWYGAGKNYEIVALLIFGTGFGGARIVNGKIDANYFGFEPKKQIANYNPKTGLSTPLSYYVSGRGMRNTYGQRGEDIKDKKILHATEERIKIAVNNAAVFWSPEVIILGGAVAMSQNYSTKRIQDFLNQRFSNMPKRPKVAKAKLGQISGLWGALALARQLIR
jgi:glucokinase